MTPAIDEVEPMDDVVLDGALVCDRLDEPTRALLSLMRILDQDGALLDCYGFDPESEAPLDRAFMRWRELGYPGGW